MSSNKRSTARKEPPMLGDMYSLDNHEHLWLMSDPSTDDEDAGDANHPSDLIDESKIDWTQDADQADDAWWDPTANGLDEAADSETDLSSRYEKAVLPEQAVVERQYNYDGQAGGDVSCSLFIMYDFILNLGLLARM